MYESFAQHEIPFAVWTPQRETATLYPVKEISTDPAIARRVFASFGKSWAQRPSTSSAEIFSPGRRTRSCCCSAFCIWPLRWVRARSSGRGHPVVAPLYAMKKSLDWEVDKFQGFVRFEEHDGMLGAVIHPKIISSPAAPALLRTLSGGGLYDLRCRPSGGAAARKARHPAAGTGSAFELPPPSAREQQFQALWTQFYRTLEIQARHNEKAA